MYRCVLIAVAVCTALTAYAHNTSVYLEPFLYPNNLTAADAISHSAFWQLSPIAYQVGRKRAYMSPQLCIHAHPWSQRIEEDGHTLHYTTPEGCDWFAFTLTTSPGIKGKLMQTYNFPSVLTARDRQQYPIGVTLVNQIVNPKSWLPYHILSLNNVVLVPYGGAKVSNPKISAFVERQKVLKRVWKEDYLVGLEPTDIISSLPDERETTPPFQDAWGGAGSHYRRGSYHELVTEDGQPVRIPPAVSPQQCSRRSSVLFVGSSHARFLASQYCAMLGLEICNTITRNDHAFGVRSQRGPATGLFNEANTYDGNLVESRDRQSSFRSATPLKASPSDNHPPRFTPEDLAFAYFVSLLQINSASLATFVRSLTAREIFPTNASARWYDPSGSFPTMNTAVQPTREEYEYAASFFTHIVVSTSPWEMFYSDMSPGDHARDISEGMLALHKIFPRAKIIVYAPHYQHRRAPPTKSVASIGRWGLDYCMYPPRIAMFRDAVQCAISPASLEAAREEARKNNAPRPDSPLAVGDVDSIPVVQFVDMWAAARDPAAFLFSDRAGHHYLDIALEGMMMNILRDYVCPPSHIQVGTEVALSSSVRLLVATARNQDDELDIRIVIGSETTVVKGFKNYPLLPLTKRPLEADAEEACKSSETILGLKNDPTHPFFPEPLCSCFRPETKKKYVTQCKEIKVHNLLTKLLTYDTRRLRDY